MVSLAPEERFIHGKGLHEKRKESNKPKFGEPDNSAQEKKEKKSYFSDP